MQKTNQGILIPRSRWRSSVTENLQEIPALKSIFDEVAVCWARTFFKKRHWHRHFLVRFSNFFRTAFLWITQNTYQRLLVALCEKYLYFQFFWSVFSRIRTEYGEVLRYLCQYFKNIEDSFFVNYYIFCTFASNRCMRSDKEMNNRKRVLIYIFFLCADVHTRHFSPTLSIFQASAFIRSFSLFFSTPTLFPCGRHKWIAHNHALSLSYASLFCQYQVFLRQLLCYM